MYKAEGNANVVLYYNGPLPDLVGRTIRLKKTPAPGAPAYDVGFGPGGAEDVVNRLVFPADALHFSRTVIRPLVGDQFVIPGTPVPVTAAFLRTMQQRVCDATTRPAARTGEVDVQQQSVVVMWDQTVIPHVRGYSPASASFCAEIKPKWGLLPQPGATRDAGDDPRAAVCRYCMHQRLKMRAGKVALRSDYCPIDLFSDDPARQRRALRSLTRVPQNNFRLFCGGAPAFTAESVPAADRAPEAYTDALKLVLEGTPFDGAPPVFLDALRRVTNHLNVLTAVRAVQQLDQHGVANACATFRGALEAAGVPGAVPTTDADQRRVAVQLARWMRSCDAGYRAARTLGEFLVSATVKDCSVMVAFRLVRRDPAAQKHGRLPPHVRFVPLRDVYPGAAGHPVLGVPGEEVADGSAGWLASSAVVDVDPKDVWRLPRLQTLDRNVVQAWNDSADEDATTCTPLPHVVPTPVPG